MEVFLNNLLGFDNNNKSISLKFPLRITRTSNTQEEPCSKWTGLRPDQDQKDEDQELKRPMRNQMQGKHANGTIGEGTKSHKPGSKKLREKRRYTSLNSLAFIGPSLLLYKVRGPYVVTLFFKHSYLSYMWYGMVWS
jgi:hypothetical protein